MPIDEGVSGENSIAITGTATGSETVGVLGKGDAQGVRGEGGAVGVHGVGNTWHGVAGLSHSESGGAGVHGEHRGGGAAVFGESKGTGAGVVGVSLNETNQAGPGVWGKSRAAGVIGESKTWMGVYGLSESTWLWAADPLREWRSD